MNKNVERLYNGIIKENPTFVLMLGMCPTLAVTSSAINGLGMGLSTTVVLILSNMLISAFRKVIPDGVRMPAFIVIVASLVTFSDVKLDDFKAEDVDQKAADKAVKDMGVNATIDEVCTAGDAGYVITTTDKDGFGGNIQITVGIKKDGTINGVSILSISETAGLGMKATEPSFYNQYVNKQADKFVVSKDGGDGEQIDALSGATITSRAVTGAVNAALGYYQNAFK